MDNIMRFIEAARRRLQRFRVITYALYGLMAGLAALLLLLVLGRFVPIAWLPVASVAVPVGAGFIGLLWGWLHRVPIEEAASAMDHVPDGAERSDMMVTALSFRRKNRWPQSGSASRRSVTVRVLRNGCRSVCLP